LTNHLQAESSDDDSSDDSSEEESSEEEEKPAAKKEAAKPAAKAAAKVGLMRPPAFAHHSSDTVRHAGSVQAATAAVAAGWCFSHGC
jgi:hypothetical protein